MAEKAVELRGVTKRFGSGPAAVVAVKELNLEIQDGEFFSLLGPSGCGKTTTLRMIAGLEIATQGSIAIFGREMGETPPFKRPVNTVFQNYALFPHMSVEKNVAFGLEMKKVPRPEIRRRVAEALEMVKLPDMARRRPNQLSGGQQQRIALARALVNHPQVLLLDEPLGALDLKLRKEMQLELKRLQEQVGITFIYVTHDQEEALTMSDRIVVMNKGVTLQLGTPHEIYEKPRTRFVADFIGETNFVEGVVEEVDGEDIIVLVDGQTPLPAHCDQSVSKGQQVTVVIRPEKFMLRDSGRATGRIEKIIYIGTDTRYIVGLTDQTQVIVREQNLDPERIRQHVVGDNVQLDWNPAHALVLTE